mgnify:CR=1 FL=1
MVSFNELQRRIRALEQAIAEREKKLQVLKRAYEGGGSPSAYTESILVENELKVLRKELEKKRVEFEEAKRELEARLPELEKRYLEKAKNQPKLLSRIKNQVEGLLKSIGELERNVEKAEQAFFPYSQACYQLQVPTKSIHLRSIPTSLSQIKRWSRIFLEWMEERTHG